MACQTYKTLVIADSRGAGLLEALNEHAGAGSIKVEVHRGAGIEEAVLNSLESLRRFKPDLILLFAGICNVTMRNRHTKITALKYLDADSTVIAVIAALDRALSILKHHGYMRVSTATLTGVDLNRYNQRSSTPKDPYQETLNAAIITINRKIIEGNRKRNIPTTWTASVIHAYYRGSYHFLYHRLRDGCHPNRATVAYWAKVMVKVIKIMKK